MKLLLDGRCSRQIASHLKSLHWEHFTVDSVDDSQFVLQFFAFLALVTNRVEQSESFTLLRSVGRDWNVSIFQVPTQRSIAA